MKNTMPRGIRNNNPGNLDYSPVWQNLDDPPSDGRFCRFRTPPDGIRAMARVLITYQDKRKAPDGSRIDTVREVIERWAPAIENDTAAYTRSVRKQMGLTAEEVEGEVDVHDHECMRRLVKAIILHENGIMPYTEAQIDKGLLMAGIHRPEAQDDLRKDPIIQSQTAQIIGTVGSGATGLTAVAALGDQLRDAADQISPLAYYGKWLMIAFVGLSVASIVVAIYVKRKQRQQGVS